jgi:hypothetical protein
METLRERGSGKEKPPLADPDSISGLQGGPSRVGALAVLR